MSEQEMILTLRKLLEPINLKLDSLDNRINNLDARMNNLDNRLNNLEYDIRKGFRETKQDIETIVEVLEAKGVLPKAQ
ncbi:MAG: hypothetical protein LIP16_03280 [Clostridium sp.]|nr:hypothetical protein [Clostridium sp.]